MRRNWSSISPKVSSATAALGASGVLVTSMPNSAAAARSTLSRPMPQRETIFSPLAPDSTRRVSGSVPAIMPTMSSPSKAAASSSVNFLPCGFVTIS